MATLISCADGNLTSSSTWAVVDSASFNNVETTATVVTTTYALSSTFTPTAGNYDGIAIKLANRGGTAGTVSVALDQAGSTVANTEVTSALTNLASAVTATADGGWYFFKFPSTVALTAVLTSVKIKTSNATQINVFSATGNWARALRTTTNAAPVAGDDLIITQELVYATSTTTTTTTRTVTMDSTASTDYGNATTSTVTPALAICNGGTLKLGVASSTAYLLKISGNIIVYNGGTLNFLQAADNFPSTSSFTLTLDCAAAVDFGILIRNGTYYSYGTPKTNTQVYLTSNLASATTTSTDITVTSTSGWAVNDVIAIGSTSRTATESQQLIVASITNGTQFRASATTATTTGGTSGTSPTQAEVVNLTRNIKVVGASSANTTYLNFTAASTVAAYYTEFANVGSATAGKRGMDIAITTGSFLAQYCSVRDGATSSIAFNVTGTSGSNNCVQALNCVTYNVGQALNVVATTAINTYDSIWSIRCTTASGLNFSDAGCTFTNSVVSSNTAGIGIAVSETGGKLGTWTNIVSHSNAASGLQIAVKGGTLTNLTSWRNGGPGCNWPSVSGLNFVNMVLFGNVTRSFSSNSSVGGICTDVNVIGGSSNGDTSFSQANGLDCGSSVAYQTGVFSNFDFSQVSGILTAHTTDILMSAATMKLTFDNCRFGGATTVGSQTLATDDSYVRIQNKNRAAGAHEYYDNVSKQTPDNVIYNTAAPSLRIAFAAATRRARTCNYFKVAVPSGSTTTVTVKVRESVIGDGAAYNGQRCRLVQVGDASSGSTTYGTDVVLATATSASSGAWETLSGTTSATTDDAVLTFYVDCGFTGWSGGWVNVDDWTAT